MIRQIRYFQAVVQYGSFSEAAEQCHISQSAISQQIQTLERELGFLLLERKNRKFFLTPAGEHFYRKSLILVADYERLCRESKKIADDDQATLSVGFLRGYTGNQFHQALAEFSQKFPNVSVHIEYGNHEELFEQLQDGTLDLALNDQRRAFSDAYENVILAKGNEQIEISAADPIAKLSSVRIEDLKNIPCILVSSKEQQENEKAYAHDVIGHEGEFLFAENLEEARLMVVGRQGFMPVVGTGPAGSPGFSLCRLPLMRSGSPVTRNYCAFWKKDNSGYYVEEFAELLKAKFEQAV